MIESSAVAVEDLTSRALLCELTSNQHAVWALEARNLALAAHWADLHPAHSIQDAAGFTNTEVGGTYAEHEEPIAGPGCPTVAEFCIAEFGAMLGLSTTAAKRMIGHALELRHRLPRTWALTQSGRVAPWRVERVAEATIHASPELTEAAMAFIDDVVVHRAGKVGQRTLERLIEEAMLRFDLLTPPSLDHEGLPIEADHETHFVHLDEQRVNSDGTMLLTAHLDLADALDLKHALEQGAAAQAAAGSTEPLGYRHAKALGDLARAKSAGSARPSGRQLVLNVHLTALRDFDGVALDPVAVLEEGERTLVLDQVRRWCLDSLTTVKVQPLIDLNADLAAPGYRPTARQYRQIQLRDHTCVFPWCGRAAAACDVDHVEPFDPGQPAADQTRSTNLAALCRRHHRLKTFSRWHVHSPTPGTFVWTSPHGHEFIRHPDGTTAALETAAIGRDGHPSGWKNRSQSPNSGTSVQLLDTSTPVLSVVET